MPCGSFPKAGSRERGFLKRGLGSENSEVLRNEILAKNRPEKANIFSKLRKWGVRSTLVANW